MRVSCAWLKEYVDFELSPPELASALTLRGVAVEAITPLNPGVRGVVVGRIAALSPHPASDRLLVAEVDAGRQRLSIVTGAPNARVGHLVPVAPPGAVLPGDWRIDAADFRGVRSEGMLLAESELLEGAHPKEGEGLWVLPGETAPGRPIFPGVPIEQVLGLDDTVLELELTPNYAAHCLSMLGVAREVAAIVGGEVRVPVRYGPAADGEGGGDAEAERLEEIVRIDVEAVDLCPRYSARVIEDVRPGPSPLWVQNRLRAAGMRPISAVVDVTNYVMLELGQPQHAFDHDCLRGRRIVVRRARPGERLVTLDGQDRALDPQMLVIADAERPTGLAGVMGGLESEITDRTRRVVLESAHFDPICTRRTARRLNLPSEAATRFIRGTDPNMTVVAADRACDLLREIGAGRPLPGAIDAYPRPRIPRAAVLRPARVCVLTGLDLRPAETADCLRRLGLATLGIGGGAGGTRPVSREDVAAALREAAPLPVRAADRERWLSLLDDEARAAAESQAATIADGEDAVIVVLPTRRPDLNYDLDPRYSARAQREADLAEEVARTHGYDRIPATLPSGPLTRGERTPGQRLIEAAKEFLLGAGLTEIWPYPLEDADGADRLRLPPDDPARLAVRLQSPLTEEQSQLRTTLLTGALAALRHNVAWRQADVAVFELGRVFLPAALPLAELPLEANRLSLAAIGAVQAKAWNAPRVDADFFYLKGVVEGLLGRLIPGATLRWTRSDHPSLHPTRQARVAAETTDPGVALSALVDLGVVGELHPEVAAAYDLPGRAVVSELDWDAIAELALSAGTVRYRPLPRFPHVDRDLALVVGEEVPAERVEAVIRGAGVELLRELRLFDLYQGPPVPPGKRSLAYSLRYRADDRTLTDAEVDAAHGRVRAALQRELGAELRS